VGRGRWPPRPRRSARSIAAVCVPTTSPLVSLFRDRGTHAGRRRSGARAAAAASARGAGSGAARRQRCAQPALRDSARRMRRGGTRRRAAGGRAERWERRRHLPRRGRVGCCLAAAELEAQCARFAHAPASAATQVAITAAATQERRPCGRSGSGGSGPARRQRGARRRRARVRTASTLTPAFVAGAPRAALAGRLRRTPRRVRACAPRRTMAATTTEPAEPRQTARRVRCVLQRPPPGRGARPARGPTCRTSLVGPCVSGRPLARGAGLPVPSPPRPSRPDVGPTPCAGRRGGPRALCCRPTPRAVVA
jgi:hypothetical protein